MQATCFPYNLGLRGRTPGEGHRERGHTVAVGYNDYTRPQVFGLYIQISLLQVTT